MVSDLTAILSILKLIYLHILMFSYKEDTEKPNLPLKLHVVLS